MYILVHTNTCYIICSCGEERTLQYSHSLLRNYASFYQVGIHTIAYCTESLADVTRSVCNFCESVS